MWKFKFFKDKAGEWRWRLRGANGEITGTGEGHTRRADAVRAAHSVKANAGQAVIVDKRATPPKRTPLLDGIVARQRQLR